MKFWQAVVGAQMAACFVWGSKYHAVWWFELASDTTAVVLSGFCWYCCNLYFDKSQLTPADLDAAARAFWVEAEKAHAAKYAERNPPA